MELAILAQDIDSFSLALLEDHKIVKSKMLQVRPEEYLKSVDETMRNWGTSINEILGVIVVTGPGSFTASRVSTTIANAIAFARSVPILGVENPNELPLEELLASYDARNSTAFVQPTYNRPANITKPRL